MTEMLLETDRLHIRPFIESDVGPYARIVADSEVMRYIADGRTHSYKEAKEYIEGCMVKQADLGYSRYAVVLKESMELMGFCGYAHFNGDLDFGWRLERRSWRKGYGTEAANEVLRYGLEVLNFPLIVAISYPANLASTRIMQKIGMDFDGYRSINGKSIIRYVKRQG